MILSTRRADFFENCEKVRDFFKKIAKTSCNMRDNKVK